MIKKLVHALGAATAAAALVLAAGTPALAYDNSVRTTDSDPGGRLEWTAYGDIVKVCDTEADGYSVYGHVGYFISEYRVIDAYDVSVGGNGKCVTVSNTTGSAYDLPEGYNISLVVCLHNASSPDFGTFCNWIEPYNG